MKRLKTQLNALLCNAVNFPFSFLLFLALLLAGCSDEEKVNHENIPVTFSFSTSESMSGRSKILPHGTSLKISIETSSGQSVLKDYSITILQAGSGYVTETIELKPGQYRITDFMLVHDSQILYATPRAGSSLAQIVSKPLPFSFNVSKDNLANIRMEVVDVTPYAPADFGYIAFDVVFNEAFQLGVFTYKNGAAEFVYYAQVYIRKGNETIKEFEITEKKTYNLSFTGKPGERYTLVVENRVGYGTYYKEFEFGSLQKEFGTKPLEVVLNPPFTFSVTVPPLENDGYRFKVFLEGEGGEIEVDWSDGVETIEITSNTELEHVYHDDGEYTVYVTGDIHRIKRFQSYYGDGPVTDVDFSSLTNLEDISFGLTTGPSVIDLTHNSKMRKFELGLDNSFDVIFPADNKITTIYLDHANIQTAEVDKIIHDVYTNAVDKNLRSGIFTLREDAYDENSTEMVGPPSAESVNKLKILRDTHGWIIYPMM